jgi:Flp pilus assembly pilin Flp
MFRRQDGQAMAEYSIILALIALAAIGTLIALGPKVEALYHSAVNGL